MSVLPGKFEFPPAKSQFLLMTLNKKVMFYFCFQQTQLEAFKIEVFNIGKLYVDVGLSARFLDVKFIYSEKATKFAIHFEFFCANEVFSCFVATFFLFFCTSIKKPGQHLISQDWTPLFWVPQVVVIASCVCWKQK